MRRLFPYLLLAAVGLLAYGGSLGGDYLYDDYRFVRDNPAVTQGAGLTEWFTNPATQAARGTWEGLYRPMRTISFRITHLLAPGPAGQRTVNLLLHLLNGALVYLLLSRLLTGRVGPLIGACAFVLHPLASEAVAWISSRGDLLMMTGMLGAVLLHLRRGRKNFVWALLLAAFAMFAKEGAVVLPLLLVLVDATKGGRGRVRRNLPVYAAHILLVIGFLGARAAVLSGQDFGQHGGLGLPGVELTGAIFASFAYYLLALLFPNWLTFELRMRLDPRLAVLGIVVFVSLIALAVVLRRRSPLVGTAVLWAGIVLLPVTVSQLVFPLKILVANRFAYPAVFSFALLLGLAASRGRRPALLSVCVLAALFPLTLARAEVWSSPSKLWGDVVAADSENFRGLFGLGGEALERGEYAEARRLFMRAAAIDRKQPQLNAMLSEACDQLAARSPNGSPQQIGYLNDALDAGLGAVRLWRDGAPDAHHLYGLMIVRTAWLAAVRSREQRFLNELLEEVVSPDAPEELALPAAHRFLMSEKLKSLAEYFGWKTEFGLLLREAAAALDERGDE